MSHEEIVETEGKFRAKIMLDEGAEKPEWDGMVPVLQLDRSMYGGTKAEAFNPQAEKFVDAFNRLADLEAGNGYIYENFERYLRIFHGATVVSSYNVGHYREYGYVGFDTAEWREAMGITDLDRLKEEKILYDVQAWAEGDVWGISVEKLVTWSTDEEDFEDMDTWEEVDGTSCWGYYGQEYAEEEAKAELKRVIEE